MEIILSLLAMVILAFALVTPILAAVALSRTGRLERRVRALEAASAPSEPATTPSPAAAFVAAQQKVASRPPRPKTPKPERVREPERPRPIEPAQQTPERTESATPRDSEALNRSARQGFDWSSLERWIGIRGAAVLGGIVLALAGILLFQHALQQGWVTPASRVTGGALLGVAAIALGEVLRRRDYRFAPQALTGGGVVVLYATTWAAYRLYGFLNAPVALLFMALNTTACAALATRMRSQLVAVLGLVGGFATPLVLSMHEGHPLTLFGYVMLLDLGILAIGARRRWPSLGVVALLGTLLIELAWTLRSFEAQFFPVAMMSLATIGILFAVIGQRFPAGKGSANLWTQAGALLTPFAFAAYFASHVDLGVALWPLAIFLAILSAGAAWVTSKEGSHWMLDGAAAGVLAVCGTWLSRTGVSDSSLWQFSLWSVALSGLFFGYQRLMSREPSARALPSSVLVSLGFAICLLVASMRGVTLSPWPWLVGTLGHFGWIVWSPKSERLRVLEFISGGIAVATLTSHWRELSRSSYAEETSVALVLFCMFGLVAVFSVRNLLSKARESETVQWTAHAAALTPLFLLMFGPFRTRWFADQPSLALCASAALAFIAIVPTLRGKHVGWTVAAMLVYVFRRANDVAWFLRRQGEYEHSSSLMLLELVAIGGLVGTLLLARRGLGASRVAWTGAGILLLFAIAPIEPWCRDGLAQPASWLSPLCTAMLAGATAFGVRERLEKGTAVRATALLWSCGVFVAMGSFAFARAVGHEVMIAAFALTGTGLVALWRLLPDKKVLVTGLTCSAFALVGLAARFGLALLGEGVYENGAVLIWNWPSYEFALPTLCLLGTSMLLRKEDPHRALAITRRVAALCGVLSGFIWLNLQVCTYFETGSTLTFELGVLQARDVTLSIVWILFALGLLGVGMVWRASGLRQVSLVFLLLTICKVFLSDLGGLVGLYRVASLFGLAVSLLLVSILYQRFVFRGTPTEYNGLERI